MNIILTLIPLNPDMSNKPKLVDDCHPLNTGNPGKIVAQNMSDKGTTSSMGMFTPPPPKNKEEKN